MSAPPAAAPGGPDRPRGRSGRTRPAAQRFGHVTGHAGTSGSGGRHDGYQVRDDETGTTYAFGGDDIVTEGFRAVQPREQVRFLINHARPGHATYVIRLDQPDIEEYYQ